MNAVWIALAIISFAGGQIFLFHMIGKWEEYVDKYYRP